MRRAGQECADPIMAKRPAARDAASNGEVPVSSVRRVAASETSWTGLRATTRCHGKPSGASVGEHHRQPAYRPDRRGRRPRERVTFMRTDDDTWDVTESVGATALTVAAARAAETEGARPLFRDPFARIFLDAAGEGMWSLFDRSAVAAVDPELAERMQELQAFVAARPAFIDDFFVAAVEAGLRQVVILAAGLDARAWRLHWPDGTRVYELDQPKVLGFKSATLREH